MNTVIKRAWNKNKLVKVEDLTGMTFQAESGGHTFEISGVDDTGAAVSLSGTVEGRFLRADNAEIIISGTASGGKASVTLSAACYAIPGRFLLTIYVTSGGQKVAVYAATGSVVATSGTASGSIPPLVTDSVQANTGIFDSINTGNSTVNGVLDVTQRRCEANLSGAGWYRVLHIDGYALGLTGIIIRLDITRNAVSNANEVHHIDLLIRSSSYSFVNEISSSNGLYITKIRYIRKTNQDYGYVDIYYSSSTTNTVTVDFSVSSRNEVKSNIVAESLQSVAASPSGETVLTEYTFEGDTNTNPITVQTHSAAAVNVAANTNNNVSISIGLSGYTPIGIVGVTGSGSAGCAISDFYIQDQSTARVYFRNNNSNAVSVTWSVQVLYKKN